MVVNRAWSAERIRFRYGQFKLESDDDQQKSSAGLSRIFKCGKIEISIMGIKNETISGSI